MRYWRILPLLLLTLAGLAHADCTMRVPEAAQRHRADLTRAARLSWGIDAPIAVFAAQVHQESAWRPDAVSRAGAQGLAQFMPATAKWWCELTGTSSVDCLPQNPAWALRAMAGYDRWLWDRLAVAGGDFDRFWASLRSYNGGLGHWQAEARNAGSHARLNVDAACGSARRAAIHCKENLNYPHRIMNVLQPCYAGWGPGLWPD